MNQERLKVLFQQYLNDNLSPKDLEELQRTIQDGRNDELLDELLKNAFTEPAFADVEDELRQSVFDAIQTKINRPKNDEVENIHLKRRMPYRWLAGVAALLVIAISVGLFFQKKNVEKPENTYVAYSIKPGGNKATLTLANGKKLILTDSLEGQLANEAGVKISKTKKGEIIYTATAGNDKGNKLQYNILSTKNGEQFQIILPDGTHVWLDAASSLKYPVTFIGNERKVELTGQGYFEVSHNAAKPFIVKTSQTEVQVLGTHFNVSAFDDEQDTKTTLLEGAVRIKSYKAAVLLKPGEQAVLNTSRQLIVSDDIDVNREIAWKNGLFDFKKAGVEEIMLKVSRWYDINVKYEGAIPETRLTGKISRNVDIKGLLSILQFEGIKWRIQGRTVIITN